jgi:hypothetical protein
VRSRGRGEDRRDHRRRAVLPAATTTETSTSFTLPHWRDFVSHALPTIVEGTLVPVALFWVALQLTGPWVALLVGLTWVYGTIARRLLCRQRVPGVFVLAAVTATARTLIAFGTHSLVLYFLQPSLGTALVSLAFLGSVFARRPLAARLAHDFCPLPDGWTDKTWVHEFFLRISLLWAFVLLANATISAWLAVSQSIGVVVVARPLSAGVLTVSAIGASVWHFTRTVRRHEPGTRLLAARVAA